MTIFVMSREKCKLRGQCVKKLYSRERKKARTKRAGRSQEVFLFSGSFFFIGPGEEEGEGHNPSGEEEIYKVALKLDI